MLFLFFCIESQIYTWCILWLSVVYRLNRNVGYIVELLLIAYTSDTLT